MRRVVWIGMMAGIAVAMGCGASPGAAGPRAPAADFTVTDLGGKIFQLSALKGKVVLIDFWATWCPPCREEIPHFKELYAAYGGKGLEIIGLALDPGGVADVAPFVREQQIPYPIAMGTPALVQAYGGIRGIPTTFLVDKQGRIAKKYVGYHGKEVFEGEIRTLLAENQ